MPCCFFSRSAQLTNKHGFRDTVVHGHYLSLVGTAYRNTQTILAKIRCYIAQNSRPFRYLLFGYRTVSFRCGATAFAHERILRFAVRAHSKYGQHLDEASANALLCGMRSRSYPMFQTTSGVSHCRRTPFLALR